MTNFTSDYKAILRNDFGAFFIKCHRELYPHVEFLDNWHIALACATVQNYLTGKKNRLIFNMPPRGLKSTMVSVAGVAWYLGHNPSRQVLCISYGQDLAEKLALDCRKIMSTQWYRTLFPKAALSKEKKRTVDFETISGGGRYTTSIGGATTGRGADFIVFDDPIKADEANSKSHLQKVNDYYDATLFSRLNDKENGTIIVVMQRLHQNDLTGHLLVQGGWDQLKLSAIAEDEEHYEIKGVSGKIYTHTRLKGEALHENRESLATLEKIRRTIGEYNFAGQYQQRPMPLEGGIIKYDLLGYYETFPPKFDSIVQSWDTASKAEELNDYSVGITFGTLGTKVYVLDVCRRKLNYPQLKRLIIEKRNQHKPDLLLIEDCSSGIALVQELRHMGIQVRAVKPEGDKVMRLVNCSAMFECGQVLLPKEASWLGEFIDELCGFPGTSHDDQIDSLTQGLYEIRRRQLFRQSNIMPAPISVGGCRSPFSMRDW